MGYGSGPEDAGALQRDRGVTWHLVSDIVLDVGRTGSYVAGLWDLDRLVHLRSAARQAARILGASARLEVSGPPGGDRTPVVVRISFVASDPGPLRRAQSGLAALLASVRRHQCS
jgi:hypothetical protein